MTPIERDGCDDQPGSGFRINPCGECGGPTDCEEKDCAGVKNGGLYCLYSVCVCNHVIIVWSMGKMPCVPKCGIKPTSFIRFSQTDMIF